MKLLPFIIFQVISSKRIFIAEKIDINSVEWTNSISYRRYGARKEDILKEIGDL